VLQIIVLEWKEVNQMQMAYEAPELLLIGEASDVVMGIGVGGSDGVGQQAAPDFEFEQD
jgi:hypothetical protein